TATPSPPGRAAAETGGSCADRSASRAPPRRRARAPREGHRSRRRRSRHGEGSRFRVEKQKCYRSLMPLPGKLDRGGHDPALDGPLSVVETACPLDCPDACSLAVTVQNGKVVTIDGSHKNPVTDGYICAKVRKFGERVYGPDRILYPGVRKGRKGEGQFARVSWEEAIELIASKSENGGASILPYSYGGSNGLLTQDNIDAQLWRRFGTSRLARTVCAAPTG